MAQGESQTATEHAFDVVLRGYDRRQVDDHIAALEARLVTTGRECSELRRQRDAEASRARDLEFRVRDGGPASTAAPTGSPAREGSWSFEGLGAKVESILRVAAEEAESIHRSAEASGRQHAEAEGRLRTTFESISDRLQPLVSRLDEESSSARTAVEDATSDAGALETAARQQAQAMIDAASTTAARMRADAETRVEITARQVADVREELALVRQILSSLAPAAGTHASTQGDATSSNGQSVSRPDLSKDSGPRDGAAAAPGDAAGQQTGPVRTPSRSGAGSASSTSAGSTGGSTAPPSQQTMPVGALPGGRNTPLSPEAPTETIALPLSDVPDGLATGGGPSPGHRQPPG